MATDATGTPTSLGIPKFNTSVDSPSGLGSNAQMDSIDALIVQTPRSGSIAGIAVGSVPVWNGTTWIKPGGTPDGTKFLRDDGTWATVTTPADWTTVSKSADESVGNTTLQDDDHLFFTATNGVVYEFQMMLIYGNSAGSAPGFKFVSGEDGTIRGGYAVQYSIVDTQGVAQLVTDQTASATAGTNAFDRLVVGRGFHRGNGGTFRLKWAQGASNATPTVLRAKSFIRYRVMT